MQSWPICWCSTAHSVQNTVDEVLVDLQNNASEIGNYSLTLSRKYSLVLYQLLCEECFQDLQCKVSKLYNMRRMKKQTFSTIYFQGILPSILYRITVCGNCLTKLFNSVEKYWYVLFRLLTTLTQRFQVKEILKKLHVNQSFTTTKETWLAKYSKFTIISHCPTWVTWL